MTRSQIKIFVAPSADDPATVEPLVNEWLADNQLIDLRNIQMSTAANGTVIVTVWFSWLLSGKAEAGGSGHAAR